MVVGPASRPSLVKVRLSAQINSIVWSLVRVGVVFGRRDRGSNAVSPSVR